MKFQTLKRMSIMFVVNHFLSVPKFFAIKAKLLSWAGYQIGDGTRIVGPFYSTGTVVIGKNCWIGRNFTVNGNGHVEIGDCCDIAPDVIFYTGGHEIGDSNRRAGKGETYHISVGNGVWIGGRSTFVKSIKVGDGSVVAACSCVVKDVLKDTLVGGVPASVMRDL